MKAGLFMFTLLAFRFRETGSAGSRSTSSKFPDNRKRNIIGSPDRESLKNRIEATEIPHVPAPVNAVEKKTDLKVITPVF
jgi:hypothetical protein